VGPYWVAVQPLSLGSWPRVVNWNTSPCKGGCGKGRIDAHEHRSRIMENRESRGRGGKKRKKGRREEKKEKTVNLCEREGLSSLSRSEAQWLVKVGLMLGGEVNLCGSDGRV